MRLALCCLLLSLTSSLCAQRVRVVPTELPTIQAAIDASAAFDAVLVMPGVYRERLVLGGRPISLRSVTGPVSTILHGDQLGSVLTIQRGASRGTVLVEGFTITGSAHAQNAGGVHIDGASPTLRNNWVRDNIGGSRGHGVSIVNSAGAVLIGNDISGNRSWAAGNGAGGGGGIGVSASAAVEIRANRISNNTVSRYSSGGGIYLFDAGATQVVGNWIEGNQARLAGGGIAIHGSSEARIENNVIVQNRVQEPGHGGGVHWLILFGSRGPDLIGNTIVANQAEVGSGVHADGDDYRARIINNLVIAGVGGSAIDCGDFSDLLPPIVQNNNAIGAAGAYTGLCENAGQLRSNLSAMPSFVPGTWQLAAGSVGIDAGDNRASRERLDIAGAPRVTDGNGDQLRVVDIGAFERLEN